MVAPNVSKRLIRGPIVMGLFLLASVYIPILAYGFAIFHSSVLIIGMSAFLIFTLIVPKERSDELKEFFGKYEERSRSIIDQNDGSEEKRTVTISKLKEISDGLSTVVNKKQRILNSLLTCFMIFVWALVYKYAGYETISHIMLAGSVAFPALSNLCFEKMSDMCYDEIVDIQKDIDNKIKTHTNNSSE